MSFEFGLLLHTRHLIRDEGPANFSEIWEQAECAEEAGYDHVWLGDSVTVLNKARGDCLTTMAALAAKTRRVRIGTVPFLPALRNPVLLAHALATLDVISGGRIILGVSVAPLHGYIERQFIACGVPFHEKAGRLSESIEVMRRLWTEKTFPFEGKYYQFKEAGILPRPIQQPAIPIWMAADDHDNAFKRAARLGDGWFTTAPTLKEFVTGRKKIDAYAQEYGRSGRIPVSALYATFNLNPNGDVAREEGWTWMEDFFREPREKLGHHFTLFGTPEECAEILQSYVDAGLTAVVARLATPDLAGQMRRFIEELRPRLSS
jgi:alkanesulfonate monooxygenase SsuD/methylene tetrahydromethanopterin reductase-like flavin-dependent oxidoreductase (luciferase family)